MSLPIEKLQPQLLATFQQIIAQGRLSQGYLFAGTPGTGKFELAQWLALRLFCQHVTAGQPDLTCPECQRILSGNHPDVVVIAPEGQSIKIDAVRQLKSELGKRGVESNQRVFIIQSAEKMTTSAANGLLKFLEEPAPQAYLILTTSAKQLILPTVRSRLQLIAFHDLPHGQLVAQMTAAEIPAGSAALLAHLTNSVPAAQALLASDYFEGLVNAIWKWLTQIQKKQAQAFVSVQTQIMPFVKEKQQQELALTIILLAYQDLLAVHFGQEKDLSFPKQRSTLTEWAQTQTGFRLRTALEQILLAQRHWQGNVNFQNVLETLTLQLLSQHTI